MKIIFLDIDGVLNSQFMFENGDTLIGSKGGKLGKRHIDALNDITDSTGSKIVLSSSWRSDKGIEGYLSEAGIKAEIIGKTPFLADRYSLRGNEILAWVKLNRDLIGAEHYDFHSYAILDDDSDMLYWQRENFFLTDAYSGLTPNIAYRVKRFLNRFPE